MVLAVLLGLLASQEAQAFYNPATGRWLNRASRGITCMHLSFLSGIMVFGLGFLLGCGKPFSGDGVMADRGYWSYPRYEIAFDSLNATSNMRRTFRFTGVPTARMTLGLVVVESERKIAAGPTFPAPEFENAILLVEIKLENGTIITKRSAALKDWKVSRSSKRVMLWHDSVRDVAFSRRAGYELTIDVSGMAAAAEPVVLRPILEGGGNEVP